MLIYTNIKHIPRKKLGLTNNEYIVADTIYQLSTNPKYEWCIMTRENLAKEMEMSKNGVVKIIDRLVKDGIVIKNEKGNLKTSQLWYDNVVEKAIPQSGTSDTTKLYEAIPQSGTNINIDNNNNNNLSGDNSLPTDKKKKMKEEALEVYEYYISKVKLYGPYNMQYNKKKLSLERIEKLLSSKKDLTKDSLFNIINSYTQNNIESIKAGYAKMCQYFFGPVERGSKVGYWEEWKSEEASSSFSSQKTYKVEDIF